MPTVATRKAKAKVKTAAKPAAKKAAAPAPPKRSHHKAKPASAKTTSTNGK